MKVILALLISFFFTLSAITVSAGERNDTLEIHKAVIKHIKRQGSRRINVGDKTYKLVSHNWKDVLGSFDPKGTEIWSRANWLQFNEEIDTLRIRNYSLSTNGKRWFRSVRRKKGVQANFTPVVISRGRLLALTSIAFIKGGSGSEILYFLEKQNGVEWSVIHAYTVSIFD
jgi:hypothetical protein